MNLIRVDDDTYHKGKVLTGSATMQFEGRFVARKGDRVSCPQHPDVSPTLGGNAQVTSRKKVFVVVASVQTAMNYVAKYIQNHDGNYARWNSTDPKVQEIYRTQLLKITPHIVDSFN
jgi:hypothetical protein